MKIAKKAIRKTAKTREKAEPKKHARIKRTAVSKSGISTSKSEPRDVQTDNVGSCWFCLEEKPLIAAHIIPKFHTREMVHPKSGHAYHIVMPLSDGVPVSGKKRQDYHRPLFCQSCDQKFSSVESAYAKWWKRLRLAQKDLKTGMRYTIDHMGKWSEERAADISIAPVITLTGVDMHLIKRMQLINIFRLHCHIGFLSGLSDSPVAQKYRAIVRRFLFPERGSLDTSHLADFSVQATYVFILSGEQFKQGILPSQPLDILPATLLTLGLEILMRGENCCFIGPVFWQIEEKLDATQQTSLTMRHDVFHRVFPDVGDMMMQYRP